MEVTELAAPHDSQPGKDDVALKINMGSTVAFPILFPSITYKPVSTSEMFKTVLEIGNKS